MTDETNYEQAYRLMFPKKPEGDEKPDGGKPDGAGDGEKKPKEPAPGDGGDGA